MSDEWVYSLLMRIKGYQMTERIAAAKPLKTCNNKPLVDLTLLAFCKPPFTLDQLKKLSMGCRIRETAAENKSSAALSRCLKHGGFPCFSFTGMSIKVFRCS